MIDYGIWGLNFKKFSLVKEQFDYPSEIHGVKHTYRVMLHCLRLGLLSGYIIEAKVAFFSAYIHDMARKHDGFCTIHGENAGRYKLPQYTELFQKNGATSGDLDTIKYLVTWHSLNQEPPKSSNLYLPLAILKDADALDRIRLGTNNLNPEFLRLEITKKYIDFGKELFYSTNNLNQISFPKVVTIAGEIDARDG